MESKRELTAKDLVTYLVSHLVFPYLIPFSLSYGLFERYFSTYEFDYKQVDVASLMAASTWPVSIPYISIKALYEVVTGKMHERIKKKNYKTTPEYILKKRMERQKEREQREEREKERIEKEKQDRWLKNYNESLKETVTCIKCKMDRPRKATYQMLFDSEYVYECNPVCDV